jgi:hypothetical protein
MHVLKKKPKARLIVVLAPSGTGITIHTASLTVSPQVITIISAASAVKVYRKASMSICILPIVCHDNDGHLVLFYFIFTNFEDAKCEK